MEGQGYVDNPENVLFFDVNTIANHDPAIIKYPDLPFGSAFERNDDDEFTQMDKK
jgi:hypothetical protein